MPHVFVPDRAAWKVGISFSFSLALRRAFLLESEYIFYELTLTSVLWIPWAASLCFRQWGGWKSAIFDYVT